MKKPLTRIHALLLGLLLLVSSAGVPVFAHICSSEGLQEISVVPTDGCCSQDEAENDGCAKPDNGCCQDEVKIVQADLPAIKNAEFQKLTAPQTIFLSTFEAFFSACIYGQQNIAFKNEEGPPLISGRQILTQISILRI